MKLIITIILLSFMATKGNAGLFDLFKLNATFKNENKKLKDSLNKEFSDIKAELGVIKNNQVKIKSDISAKVNAKIGYDRSITKDTKAGRDVTVTTTNDTGFLKALIGSLSGIILALIGAIVLLMRMIFRYMKEKKDFKRKYYEVLNGGKNAPSS